MVARPARAHASPRPSSPTARVYFGSENGTVYALTRSRAACAGPTRPPARSRARSRSRTASSSSATTRARSTRCAPPTGKRSGRPRRKGAKFGFAPGRFYCNAAVANGRVFIGNVDGYVYSFSRGRRASSRGARRPAATSTRRPSVGAGPGGKPTVFIGSYDGTFYALDARSGAVKWRHGPAARSPAARRCSATSSASATSGTASTLRLDTRTGKQVFGFRKGGYATLITDQKTLFLVGYGAMYALEPLIAEKRRKIYASKIRRRQKAVDRRRFCARRANEALHAPEAPDGGVPQLRPAPERVVASAAASSRAVRKKAKRNPDVQDPAPLPRAGAALSAGADRDARRDQRVAGLLDRVLAVVEDRRGQRGVGAGPRSPRPCAAARRRRPTR